MRLSDFHYDLPRELIAQAPADRREHARLLVVRGDRPEDCVDSRFDSIGDWLPEDAVVVVNDTRVIPARVRTHKPSGGAVELLFLEELAPERWRCMARSSRALYAGALLRAVGADDVELEVVAPRGADSCVEVRAPAGVDVLAMLERAGEPPLPPYIERPGGATDQDRARYQTVFAERPGAIAAPTAALHFSRDLLDRVTGGRRTLARVTLHVGLGTFAPVRGESLDQHIMHRERFSVPPETVALVESGRPVVAVGTTVVRALEAAARGARDSTDLFIRPGFEFRRVDHLVTNFHLPESTLLMLVSAFAGHGRVMDAYRRAVERRYRFFSYGDAMLLSRADRGQR